MISTVENNVGFNKIVIDGAIQHAVKQCQSRLLIAIFIFLGCYLVIGVRLLELSTFDSDNINKITIPSFESVKMEREDIIDREGVLLSTNLKTISLFANPKKIIDPEAAALELSSYFDDLSYEKLLKNLSSKKSFVWIKRNLPPQEFQAVHEMGIPGVYSRNEEKRIYPHGNLVSHILGFVGSGGKGLSGIEKYFNESLSENKLQLSIDVRVQEILHTELSKNVDRFKAKGGAGIVMDVNTGEIMAVVSLPDFDPNNPRKVKPSTTFNMATYGVYEMGSIFKPFTIAGALDDGVIDVNDRFDATKPLRFAGHTIRDHHAKNKWLNTQEVLMYSSNIGMARIAKEYGSERQIKFLSKLGLFDKVDIEISETGKPIYPDHWGTIHSMTASYGHGIAVSPLHVAAAMSATVNGGIYFKPTLIKQDSDVHGEQIMKKETSNIMRKLLRRVVEEGTGKFAAAKGYLVGGKTGTAEKLVNGKYDRKAKFSSFLAAFPMHKPKYVILVVLDEPKGDKKTFGIATGGFTAAPVVSRVISKIGPLLGISPVDEDSPKIRKVLKFKESSRRKDIAFN
jgi:cell division protein FtsI (penicillin-binding protein 3)